jgi:hypothetical protein
VNGGSLRPPAPRAARRALQSVAPPRTNYRFA